MLQEGKSLQHTKIYLSNRNLRVCTFQDQLQCGPHQPGSKLSLIATNNNSISQQQTPNMLIGDADTFFLLRENDKYQQQINELIDQIQENNMKQFEERVENQQLKQKLYYLRMRDCKASQTINILCQMSKKLTSALKIKSQMAIKMTKLIKKLEKSQQNLTTQLIAASTSKDQLQNKYGELQKQIKMYQLKMRSRVQKQIQTESITYQHIALQVQNDLILFKQTSSQSQPAINYQQQSQTFLFSNSQETNTLQVEMKDSSSLTQNALLQQQSLQFGSSIFSLSQIAQQTNQSMLSQIVTQHESKVLLLQAQIQYQYFEQTPQTELFQVWSQTDRIQTKSIPTMAEKIQNDQKHIQTQQQYELKLQQNAIYQIISLIPVKQMSEKQIIFKRQLNIIHQFSIQIQQSCQHTFQTEVTEEDDLSLKLGLADREVSQNILSYFKQINSKKNQINYNEQIVRDLEEKGQNQASKALARLMKQHMCLKLCLNRMMQKQEQQLQSHNQKIIDVFQQSMQYEQKSPSKKGNSQKEQCTIY